jgi:hypothetical protein
MSAGARSTLALSVALVLALAACSSSANNPPVREAAASDASADAGAAVEAGDGPTRDVPEAGTGVGLGCPSSFTARAVGTPCFSIQTACDYPEGRCGCLVCEMSTSNFGFAWSCRPWDSGGNGCPARAPAAGEPCDAAGLVCRYDAYCSVSVGDDLECKDGTWQAAAKLDPCGYRSCPL